MEIQEIIGGEKLVSVSTGNSFEKFCSTGNEENTALPGGKEGSGEVFHKMREITAYMWVDGNDPEDRFCRGKN